MFESWQHHYSGVAGRMEVNALGEAFISAQVRLSSNYEICIFRLSSETTIEIITTVSYKIKKKRHPIAVPLH